MLKKYRLSIFAALTIFAILLPASNFVNFVQNDEWVYYSMIQGFLRGDFSLHPYTGATFYLQGFLGLVFATLFGIQKLPILTLIISVLSFWVFSVTLQKHFNLSSIKSVLISTLLFVNPLNIYSVFGFMTEEYFLICLLFSVFFILNHQQNPTTKNLLFANIFIVASLFVRQAAFITVLAWIIHLVYKKDYRGATLEICVFILMSAYYINGLPATPEMYARNLNYEHLFDIKYVLAVVYGILIYLGAYLTPFITMFSFEAVKNWHQEKKYEKIVTWMVVLIGIYFALNLTFAPSELAWGEFPYFDNTVERKGFFPRFIHGDKYHFVGIYDIYVWWEIMSKIGAALLLTTLLFKKPKLINFFSIHIVLYLILMIFALKVYDRYLLYIFPMLILFLIPHLKFNRIWLVTILLFTLLLGFYSYQFGMDYLLTNRLIWNKSRQLIKVHKINPDLVGSTHAWQKTYGWDGQHGEFLFSFSKENLVNRYMCRWQLMETVDVNFPLSWFINPKIYIYKK